MKCINCGNLIPDASTVCPYCNSKVEGTVPVQAVYNTAPISQTAVLPVTPTQAVLPQDNAMNVTGVIPVGGNSGFIQPASNSAASQPVIPNAPVAPTVDQAMPVQQNLVQPQVVAAPVAVQPVVAPVSPEVAVQPVVTSGTPEVAVQPVVTSVTPEVAVQPVVASVTPEVAVQPVVASVTPEIAVQPVVAPVTQQSTVQPTSTVSIAPIQEEVINQNVVSTGTNGIDSNPFPTAPVQSDGAKVGSAAPVIEKKTTSKKGIIIKLIVLVVIIALIGGAIYVYMFEFKSGSKRIDSALNTFLKSLYAIDTSSIESKDGNYDIDLDITCNDKTYGYDGSGIYAYDLSKQIYRLTADTESINIGEEILADGTPMSVELYAFDSKIYLLLQNFTDGEYIYKDNSKYGSLLSGISKNDNFDYSSVLIGALSAFTSSVNSIGYTQTIKDYSIGSYNKKANVVTINLSSDSKKAVISSFLTILKSNTAFMENAAAALDITTDELTKKMEEYENSLNFEERNESIDIVTGVTNSNFVGLRYKGTYDSKETVIDITPYQTGYKFLVNRDGVKVLEATYTKQESSTTTIRTTNYVIEGVVSGKDSDGNVAAYNVNLNLVINDNINSKVDRITVKNSFDANNMTVEKYQTIQSKIASFDSKFGNRKDDLMSYTEDFLNGIPLSNKFGTKFVDYFEDFVKDPSTIEETTTDANVNAVDTTTTASSSSTVITSSTTTSSITTSVSSTN